ncbi:PilZ domain-containing protein [Thermincola ferriacetica]
MLVDKSRTVYPRRYFRIPADMSVEFNIMRFQKRDVKHLMDKKGFGQCRDLGEDGLSFVSQLKLPIGMVLRVTLHLPHLGDERVLARVVRCEPVTEGNLIAVQFFNINDRRREKVRAYIAEEAKKQYKFLNNL